MNQPIIVWCVIAGVLLSAFVFRTVARHYTGECNKTPKAKPLFELAKERDIFYVPGDEEDDEFGYM